MGVPRAQRTMSIVAPPHSRSHSDSGCVGVLVTIVGNNSYPCGSGVSYPCGSGVADSRHTWTIDSQTLAGRTQDASSACPDKVSARQSLAITIGALSLVGVVVLVVRPSLHLSIRRKTRRTRPRSQETSRGTPEASLRGRVPGPHGL